MSEENKNKESELPEEFMDNSSSFMEETAGENVPVPEQPINELNDSNDLNENMETHAHHLHHAPGKKFWHYFYEFLMLFLAVFCGFIAENMREHYVEHQREKKYITSLIEDIKSDTALLKKSIAFNRSRIKTVDTLLAELSDENLFTDCRRAYDLANQSGFWDFISNDGTIQQLKSSGGLRLVRNQKIVDNIMSYDKMVRAVYGHQDIFNQFMITLIDNNLKFFPTMTVEKMKGKPVPLLLKDRSPVEIYYGMEYQYQILLDMLCGMQEELLKRGREFIVNIQKEYHLD